MRVFPRRPDPSPTQGFYLIPPRQGRTSLLGMEGAFASLRSRSAEFSFEIFGTEGLVSYFVRAQNYPALSGILSSCYPQAQLADPREYRGRDDNVSRDWLRTNPNEALYVLPMHLRREPYLPLRFYTDQSLARGETDPLASVLGYLSAASAAGRRVGARLLIKPAPAGWSRPWQRQLQRRKDRQDLAPATSQQTTRTTPSRPDTSGFDPLAGASPAMMFAFAALAAAAYGGYYLYEREMMATLVALGAGVPLLGGGYLAYRQIFKHDTVRAYYDEEMAAAKMGAQGFHVELQLVAVLPKGLGKNRAVEVLEGLAAVYSQFDNEAGNSWEPGKTKLIAPRGNPPPPGRSPHALDLGPPAQNPRRMKRTILSPRELGTIWHLPMGEEEAALMIRAGSRQLRTYLQGVDHGAMIGYAIGTDDPIHISDQVLRRHMLLLGKSGMGKSTLATHIVAGKMQDKAKGLDDDAIVVIDPHADLIRDILRQIPPEIAHKVRLLDIGNRERVPAINLLDPQLHKDRDRCVSVVIESLRHLSQNIWGPRMQEIVDCMLKTIYEYNDHELTTREEMLTMLDILPLMSFETPQSSGGRWPTGPAPLSDFQKRVLQRVDDPDLLRRFDVYSRWSEQLRHDAFAPVENRLGGFASDRHPRAIMGQWETTIDFAEVIREGQILLVNTARGTVGHYVSALMGSTVVSLIDSALREQEQLDRAQRRNCLLLVDEFHSISGTDWEGLLAEIRKYGGMVVLVTQGLTRLDTDDRKLKAGVLSNVGAMVSYQVSGEDAHAVVEQMGRDFGLTETDLVNLDPYSAYMKLTGDDVALPPFSIRTRPPESGSGEALHAIVTGMMAYTRDRAEALHQIALRMQANGGDLGLGIDTTPKAGSEQGRPAPRPEHSALPPDIVAQVLADMDDGTATTEEPSSQVAETPAAQPSRGAPRDPNVAFRRSRPRKRG